MTPLRHAASILGSLSLSLSLALGCACARAATAAVESCLPPACSSPIAVSWPDAFGSTALEKLGMAVSLACAWILVWGIILAIGHKPRRRQPLFFAGLAESSKAYWRDMRAAEDEEWRAMRTDPARRSATRRLGLLMIAGSLVSMKFAMLLDGSGPDDLSGSIARVQRWTNSGFTSDATLRLDKHGLACSVAGDSCFPWGTWIARTNLLILTPSDLSASSPSWMLTPDESKSMYWAKPQSGNRLDFGVAIERPKANSSPNAFDAKSASRFD